VLLIAGLPPHGDLRKGDSDRVNRGPPREKSAGLFSLGVRVATKRIGAAAKKIELSLDELGKKIDASFDLGVEAGLDAAKRAGTLPSHVGCQWCVIRKLLNLGGDCPMCAANEEMHGVQDRLRVLLDRKPGSGRRLG